MMLHQTVGLSRLVATFLLLAPFASASQLSIGAAQDSTIYAESGSVANGSGSFLFSGKNSMSNTRRALLRFDLASTLPAGSTITSVQLVLHVSQAQAGAFAQHVQRVNASWGEGASDAPGAEGSGTAASPNDATWTERFFGASMPWTTPGGDFTASASTSVLVDGIGTYTFPSTAALVADAQSMLDAPALNFGWILRDDEATASSAKRFDSRQNIDPTLQPQLVVVFDLPCLAPTTYCTAAPNSASPSGAHMGSIGSPSVSTNSFILTATGVPANTLAIFYFGPTQQSVPFGNGVRCVGGSQRRLGVHATAGGGLQQQLDFTLAPANGIAAGTTWNFQLWYQDPAGGGAGFNLSDGLNVTFCQ